MNASERVVARAIAEQARVWLITNRERELSEEQRGDFLAWLRASPMHVREYLVIAELATEMRSVADTVETTTEELVAMARNDQDDNVTSMAAWQSELDEWPDTAALQPRARARKAPRFTAIAASIGALAIAALSWWSLTQLSMHKEYLTVHGEQRIVQLEDGSVLHLNSDSMVLVDYSKTERSVSMARGQALFKVAKDKSRPFRVRAGATDVVAVGTEFDVRRLSDDVLVTVVEGAVALSKVPDFNLAGGVPPPAPLQLGAGQQARVVRGLLPTTRAAVDVRIVDVRPAVAWVQQKIVFESQTLQSVVSEFNRYGTTQLVIEDAEAAKLRISGIFNAYDLESFVLYLETLRGLEVHRDLNLIRISLARNKHGETM
jgi:transmembrane sensor